MAVPGNLSRFSGFAGDYDAARPSPPPALGPLLARYAGRERPRVVDIGSGSGLSSRWATTWASSVVGVEPNDDMRAVAQSHPVPGLSFVAGTSDATGLPDASADVVTVCQAMHWMDPGPTHDEIARILVPGGVLAVIDADWPPVTGDVRVERAWGRVHRRMQRFADQLVLEESIDDLRRPVPEPAEIFFQLVDSHGRDAPEGVRSWSKSGHLRRIADSGHYSFARELVSDGVEPGGAERVCAMLRTQAGYHQLRRLGLSDADIGTDVFDAEVHAALDESVGVATLWFSWRVRLGVTPSG